jgi:hypothetical protein
VLVGALGSESGRRESCCGGLESGVVGDVETPIGPEPRDLALLDIAICKGEEIRNLTR